MRSPDCERSGCDPNSAAPGLWNGKWQVPAAVGCPVCSTAFPVVNTVALDAGGCTLFFGGYGRVLHAVPMGVPVAAVPD